MCMLNEREDMKNYKIILTDCDGVLLNWEAAFHQWMESHGRKVVASGMYDIAQQYGLTKPEGKTLIKIFNESAWMGYLKAFRDARSGVAKLYEHGYRFHCITSLSLDQKAQRLRAYNLENVFGKGTFKNAWIVADEMQNATPSQMKMLLTRIGNNSKIVVTGDLNQHDRGFEHNGLKDFVGLLKTRNNKMISVVEFTKDEVERHPAVSAVLDIYGDDNIK